MQNTSVKPTYLARVSGACVTSRNATVRQQLRMEAQVSASSPWKPTISNGTSQHPFSSSVGWLA